MLNVGQPDIIGPAIGADGNRMAAAVVGAIDQQPAHAACRPSLRRVILVGRPVMPSIMYDGCLRALGNSLVRFRAVLEMAIGSSRWPRPGELGGLNDATVYVHDPRDAVRRSVDAGGRCAAAGLNDHALLQRK